MARTLPTERTPEEEVDITRPSWSKPEVKRLSKDDFFKEVYDIDEVIDVFCNLLKLVSELGIVFHTQNIKFRWVGRKCLLGIDNQGHCCCCWAFTSTEAITAVYALKNKREIVSLSKQQLIDCMYTKYKKPSYFADLGEKECFPCSYNKAYKLAMDYGITVETKYPFMEERGKCECQTEMRVIKIKGFQRVSELIKELEEKAKEKLDENEIIEKLIRQQPITCAALHVPSLQLHRGKGVYMGPTENEIAQVRQKETEGQVVGKHAMLIVGYGEEEGVEFYLVKNSWGTEWGYQGYAKIKRSALSKLSYPIIH